MAGKKDKAPRTSAFTARELIVELAKCDPSARVHFCQRPDALAGGWESRGTVASAGAQVPVVLAPVKVIAAARDESGNSVVALRTDSL